MKIISLDRNVEEVLSSGYYKIPRFQRPFSWEKDQVEEFWADTISDNEIDYFIGSLVIYEADKKRKTFGIVDGQQRLTTITLILCALRNAFADEGLRDQAEGIHRLIERENIDNEHEYVLQPETSYPYFQEHIQKWQNPDAHGRAGAEEALLKEAYDIIEANISDAVNASKTDPTLSQELKKKKIKDTLIQIRSQILGLKVINITLDNEDDAYIIFETMNARGKNLTLSDLLKSYLLKLIRPNNANVDIYKEKWSAMAQMLEKNNAPLNEFLYHHWLSKYARYVPAKRLYKSIRHEIKASNAKAYFDELELNAGIYSAIASPTAQNWSKNDQELRRVLRSFSVFRVKQQMPMLLAILREYKTGHLRYKYALDILQAIENFHFIFSAVTSQRSSGGISSMYAAHAIRLSKSETVEERLRVLQSLKVELRRRLPSYQEFEANFSEIKYTEDYDKQKRLVQYILGKIDLHHQAGLPVDYEQMTIEHLAAQNARTGKAIQEKSLGMLGNLLLVSQELNVELSNKPFAEKKWILQASRVWVDEKIMGSTSWQEKEITERTHNLARAAFDEIWNVTD